MIERVHADLLGKRVALFSDCDRYRYLLRIPTIMPAARSATPQRVAFCMLNPSTATESINDPTVAKCIRFASRWGFDELTVVNIFAWRSTDPSVLPGVMEPIGAENDRVIVDTAAHVDMVICAWGRHGALHGRGEAVRRILPADKRFYLRLTDVEPWHPLYLPDATQPTRWV